MLISSIKLDKIIYPTTPSFDWAEDVAQNLAVEGLVIPRIDNEGKNPIILSGKDNPISIGVRAEIGSIYTRNDPAEIYQKIGNKDQEWKKFEPGIGLGLDSKGATFQAVLGGNYEAPPLELEGGEPVKVIATLTVFNNSPISSAVIAIVIRDGLIIDSFSIFDFLDPFELRTKTLIRTVTNQPAGIHTYGIVTSPIDIQILKLSTIKL